MTENPAIFDAGPPPPCPAPFNMAAYVLGHAMDQPDQTALIIAGAQGGARLTYRDLHRRVMGLSAALGAASLGPGDRLVLRLGNSVEFPLAFLAAIAADIIPVPLSSQLTTAEIAPILRELAPSAICHDPSLPLPDTTCPVVSIDALGVMQHEAPRQPAMGDPDRPAYIIYTSGTGGRPRAVIHAHRAIWARRMMWRDWYGLKSDDRLMHAGAFNWTYTLGTGLMDPWSIGATALVPAPHAVPADLPALMQQHAATIFAAAPGVYRQMLRAHPRMALTHLRHGLSAGEKLPPDIATAWTDATGCPIYEALGMSECSTFISSGPGRDVLPPALGRPQTGRRVAVIDAAGPVDRGQPGTLAVALDDPGLMLGYLDGGKPVIPAERRRDGWFLTGDTVTMGADDEITYLGRDDDMMNAGGFRVSPVEVERCFAVFDGLECAAAEVRPRADTSLIALFYRSAGAPDEATLRARATDRLARYKQPRLYIPLPQLPHSANGKINRRVLRESYEADHDQA